MIRSIIASAILVVSAAFAHQAKAADLGLNTTPVLCGNATSGRCTVYDDGVTRYSWYWYWNGTSGNASLTQYGIDSNNVLFVQDVYNATLTSTPRNGLANLYLTDQVGNSVSFSYAGHEARVLIRSGHNYYQYKTYVDSGTITLP